MNKRVVTVYFNFRNTGGAQKMAMRLAEKLAVDDSLPIVFTDTPAHDVHEAYRNRAVFKAFTVANVLKFAAEGYVFLSHDRKSTTRLMLLKCVCGRRIKIAHVSHNVFDNLRLLTILPKKIISISSAVTDNLKSYFKIKPDRIIYIPNGLPDWGVRPVNDRESIKILLAGRICRVKRQIEIAGAFSRCDTSGISLYFAGSGEDVSRLQQIISGTSNIHFLGEIDMAERIGDFDYVLLFSEKEGLPLVLIEACMSGKPMLTNDLPSVKDVNVDNETGFVYDSLSKLTDSLSDLPKPSSKKYNDMSINARRRYERLFTENQMIDSYRDVIDSL